MRDSNCFSRNGKKKKVFENRNEARTFRQAMPDASNFTEYHCTDCGKFHLTKAKKPRKSVHW